MVSRPRPDPDPRALPASMEPCLFRHGKKERRARELFGNDALQWSHVFSDMVSPARAGPWGDSRPASMEPCLFRHGKTREPRELAESLRAASMEPCLFRHGKVISV